MNWRFWYRGWHILHRSQALTTVRTLVFVGIGILLIWQCLTQGLQAAPRMPTGMGCHHDCWYDRPSGQPVAVLQQVPGLLSPQSSVRFLKPAKHALPEYNDHRRALPPRSPPLTPQQ